MQTKREYSFDILRVISMIMVIIIHVSNVYCRKYGIISSSNYLYALIYNTISRVSVPIFFMISGSLLLERDFNKKKYFQRIFKFLILIIVWDIIYLVWEYFYLNITYNKLYLLFIKPYRAHLWFLYTIIILYLIQPLLKIILAKSNKTIKILLFIIWILFSTLSMYNSTISQIFTIFSYIGYFIIGKYLYEYLKKQDPYKKSLITIAILLLILSYIGSIYLNYKASSQFNLFYNLFFAYRTPYIILCSFIFFSLIYNCCHLQEPPKLIMFLSDVSLGVYLIHGIFLDITIKLFNNYLTINSLWGIPIFTFIIFICSIVSIVLLRKTKLLAKIL